MNRESLFNFLKKSVRDFMIQSGGGKKSLSYSILFIYLSHFFYLGSSLKIIAFSSSYTFRVVNSNSFVDTVYRFSHLNLLIWVKKYW